MSTRSRPPSLAAPGQKAADASGRFPAVRMRRNRKAPWTRELVAEHRLSPSDLIWPMFVVEGKDKRVPVASMPGVERLSVDLIVRGLDGALKQKGKSVTVIGIGPLLRQNGVLEKLAALGASIDHPG